MEKLHHELFEKARQWNTLHPIGTPVIRYKLMDPLREGEKTITASEAWVMGGYKIFVILKGLHGELDDPVDLESIQVIQNAS